MAHYIESNAELIKQQIGQILPVLEKVIEEEREEKRKQTKQIHKRQAEADKRWKRFEKRCIDQIKNEVSTYTKTKFQLQYPYIVVYKVTDPRIEEKYSYQHLRELAQKRFREKWDKELNNWQFENQYSFLNTIPMHNYKTLLTLLKAKFELEELLDTVKKVCDNPDQQTIWIDADEYNRLIGRRLK